MKYWILLIYLAISCKANINKNSNVLEADISFENDTLSIGKVPIGDSAYVEYRFKNTGDTALKVLNVAGACSCTIAAYDSSFIQPGGKGNIKVKYKNANDSGEIFKVVVVEINQTKKPLRSLFLISKKT